MKLLISRWSVGLFAAVMVVAALVDPRDYSLAYAVPALLWLVADALMRRRAPSPVPVRA